MQLASNGWLRSRHFHDSPTEGVDQTKLQSLVDSRSYSSLRLEVTLMSFILHQERKHNNNSLDTFLNCRINKLRTRQESLLTTKVDLYLLSGRNADGNDVK